MGIYWEVIKCESAKVNMYYKMRKFDAKDFAFYTSPFWVNFPHFRIIRKNLEFISQVQLPNRLASVILLFN